MRFRMHTRSGAVYVIDTDAMTWDRKRPTATNASILGLDKDNGTLTDIPDPSIGYRCVLNIPGTYITTTQVERLELLDD